VYPKIRSPLASWLLTVFTGGIYLIFWSWRVATELNSAENRTVFRVDIWRRAFVALLFLTVVGAVVAAKMNNPIILLVTALCLFSLFVHVQLAIGNYIKSKDIQLNTGGSYSHTVSIVLFWFVANLGVVYMQSGINRAIRHERAHS